MQYLQWSLIGHNKLSGDITKWFSIPLSILLHDGLQPASSWEQSAVSTASHVVQMIENGYQAAKTFGDSLFLLDRYFLSVPALKRLNERNASGSVRMDLVTMAKKSCAAYELPPARKPGRGRPAKKGSSVKLKELFNTPQLRTSFRKQQKPFTANARQYVITTWTCSGGRNSISHCGSYWWNTMVYRVSSRVPA